MQKRCKAKACPTRLVFAASNRHLRAAPDLQDCRNDPFDRTRGLRKHDIFPAIFRLTGLLLAFDTGAAAAARLRDDAPLQMPPARSRSSSTTRRSPASISPAGRHSSDCNARAATSNQKAREQLIEEALKLQEAARIRVLASDSQVDASYERFAASNNLSAKQMNAGAQPGRRDAKAFQVLHPGADELAKGGWRSRRGRRRYFHPGSCDEDARTG